MRFPAINRFALFGLVVLALAALAGVAWLSKPVTVAAGAQPSTLRTATISTGLRACAAPGSPGQRDSVAVLAATAAKPGPGKTVISRLAGATRTPGNSGSGSGSSGSAPGASNPPASPPLTTLSTPGALSVTSVPIAPSGQPGGVMIQASGAMAQGLEAEQTTSDGDVSASCGSPATDYWFTGPGQASAGTIELYLMNVDSQASDVEVDISTDAGPLQTSSDTGISVPPHSEVVQSLAGLVRGSRALSLHVRTSVGRVIAAVRESTKTSDQGQWLPAGLPPASRLVIPGMPSVKGDRTLLLAAPGSGDATVKMTVVTPNGSYQPTGGGAISVPAGSATRVELPSLSGVTGAAMLTSSVPVTAALQVSGGQPGAPGAFATGAQVLQEQGVVADAGQSSGTSTLVLSAPAGTARVRLVSGGTGLSSTASSNAQVVQIPAKHSVTVQLSAPSGASKKSPFAVVATPLPGSGPVYAGRVLAGPGAGGAVLGIVPVASALTWAPLPPVHDSLLTVAP